ncbi:hypothetical protein DY000_02034878 [Brassica cretica]|uniref:Uncharacterized protein n=1 Tax=Brassica cretica TaxID=69181 RepID=A0ABQ7DKK1_BRACR|nr:hypothetical protein DY000_02034878 [Brassica cretica]
MVDSTNSVAELTESFAIKAEESKALQLELTKTVERERLLRQFMVISWVGFAALTAVIVTMGRLVGLGRRTRSVPPSSAPPPFVDPEVLTAQLKDKDDRISLLETQMAAQQAGYEAQRRLNQQMMEKMQRMYPNEVFPDVPDP